MILLLCSSIWKVANSLLLIILLTILNLVVFLNLYFLKFYDAAYISILK